MSCHILDCPSDVLQYMGHFLPLSALKHLSMCCKVLYRSMQTWIKFKREERWRKMQSPQFSQRLFNLLTHRELLKQYLPESNHVPNVVFRLQKDGKICYNFDMVRHITLVFDDDPPPDTIIEIRIGGLSILDDTIGSMVKERAWFEGTYRYLVHWYPMTYFYRTLIMFHTCYVVCSLPFYRIMISGYKRSRGLFISPWEYDYKDMIVRTSGGGWSAVWYELGIGGKVGLCNFIDMMRIIGGRCQLDKDKIIFNSCIVS